MTHIARPRRPRTVTAQTINPKLARWFQGEAVPTFGTMEDFFDELRAAWNVSRTWILADWVKHHPGSRPRGWWCFDAPELRKRLSGIGTPYVTEIKSGDDYEYLYANGVPRIWRDTGFDKPLVFESEPASLQRLGLFAPAEARRIRKSAFEPVTLTLDENGVLTDVQQD